MANNDRPRGFEPYGDVKQTLKAVAGSKVVAGEFVALADDGKVDAVAAGADIYGLALSRAGADGDEVLLSIHPEQLYVGQASASDIDAQTDIGNLVDIVATAENSTYDAARHEIDSTSIGTGSGGQLVVLGIEERPDNALGEFVDVVCKINEHQAFGEDDFAGI